MPAVISLLRGVNVGGHKKIKMEDLRSLYESLKLRGAKTYIQSGNVVFQTARPLTGLAEHIEDALERRFGFRPEVILRTASDLREVVARNPFALRPEIHPGKLVVLFLQLNPGPKEREAASQMNTSPEELVVEGSEIYMYFPNGMGRSKISSAAIEKILRTRGTARNWNTVTKLLEMAEAL